MEPVELREDTIHGQRVLVKVYPAQASRPECWVRPKSLALSIDQDFYADD